MSISPAQECIRLAAAAADSGSRLDRFLASHLPAFSRARLQQWIKEGRVEVNGKPVKASYLLHGRESVAVRPAPLPPLRAEPENIPLSVLYEDADVIAIDKPAGMVVHAGAGRHAGTLVNALLHRFERLSQVGGELRPGIVHRLDKDTSGVILAARNDAAHRALAAQFASRRVEKIYLAMVHGVPLPAGGEINKPVARDPVRRTRMTASLGVGRAAITRYRILERLGDYSFLEVRIGTGRTHQIRVHLASVGHPIVGDALYGAPALPSSGPPLHRFFLHAHRITFLHPVTQESITVVSPLAADLEAWRARLL